MAHELKKLPYAYDALKGISKEVVTWHHDTHHKGYVDKRNEIEEKLKSADRSSANANYSEYGELKRRETFNASGMILHEIYWDVMGGDGKIDENLSVVKKIKEDFVSLNAWQEDFVACAKASLGWTILCYDPSDGKLHNYLCDFHNNGAVWGAIPLLPIDVWEHAYYRDYGPKRPGYVDAFLENVNWSKVDELFKTIPK
jgi:Fe-Mn family superoxide dismutase